MQYLQVERISTRARKYNWELFSHIHPDLFQIGLLKAGYARVYLGDEILDLSPQTAVILPKQIRHHFDLSKTADLRMMTIEADYFLSSVSQMSDTILGASLSSPAVVTLHRQPDDYSALASTFANIEAHQSLVKPKTRAAVLHANLMAALSLISDHIKIDRKAENSVTQTRLFLAFSEAVENGFASQKTVSQYASDLSVTEQSLYRACKSAVGLSPSKVVQQRVIKEAQNRLKYTDATVTEIAYALNFTTPSSFSRFFSDRVGRSPAEFRRQPIFE